jgi:hypothetical protein
MIGLVNNELGRKLKKAGMAHFKALFRYLFGEPDENH